METFTVNKMPVRFSTITLQLPASMIHVTPSGKVTAKAKPVTAKGQLTRRQGKPSVVVETADVDRPRITSEGEQVTLAEARAEGKPKRILVKNEKERIKKEKEHKESQAKAQAELQALAEKIKADMTLTKAKKKKALQELELTRALATKKAFVDTLTNIAGANKKAQIIKEAREHAGMANEDRPVPPPAPAPQPTARERRNAQTLERYRQNRDTEMERRRQTVECETCGRTVRRDNYTRHRTSQHGYQSTRRQNRESGGS